MSEFENHPPPEITQDVKTKSTENPTLSATTIKNIQDRRPERGTNELVEKSNSPENQVEKDKPAVSDNIHWEDRGIVDVPTADLPWPEGVNGPQDFNNHLSYPDAIKANEESQKMKPLIEKGYTSDDFAQLDEKNGLIYSNGQQRVYDLYYGNDQVRLYKDGDKYDIVNGRHRIFIAKQAGNESIPARVIEKVGDQSNEQKGGS